MNLTPAIIRTAATDAGNRSMRKGNRTAWNEDDYDAACAEFERLSQMLDPSLGGRLKLDPAA